MIRKNVLIGLITIAVLFIGIVVVDYYRASQAEQKVNAYIQNNGSKLVRVHEEIAKEITKEERDLKSYDLSLSKINEQRESINALETSAPSVYSSIFFEKSKPKVALNEQSQQLDELYGNLYAREVVYKDAQQVFSTYEDSRQSSEDYKAMLSKSSQTVKKLKELSDYSNADEELIKAYDKLYLTYVSAQSAKNENDYTVYLDQHDETFGRITGQLGENLEERDKKALANIEEVLKTIDSEY